MIRNIPWFEREWSLWSLLKVKRSIHESCKTFISLLTLSIKVINLLLSAFFANFCSRSREFHFCFRLIFLCPVLYSMALLTRVTWMDGSRHNGSSVAIWMYHVWVSYPPYVYLQLTNTFDSTSRAISCVHADPQTSLSSNMSVHRLSAVGRITTRLILGSTSCCCAEWRWSCISTIKEPNHPITISPYSQY